MRIYARALTPTSSFIGRIFRIVTQFSYCLDTIALLGVVAWGNLRRVRSCLHRVGVRGDAVNGRIDSSVRRFQFGTEATAQYSFRMPVSVCCSCRGSGAGTRAAALKYLIRGPSHPILLQEEGGSTADRPLHASGVGQVRRRTVTRANAAGPNHAAQRSRAEVYTMPSAHSRARPGNRRTDME